ncbi:MAG: hypothetical protein U5K29_00195 [Acidimicrobiales bacterium]|nr:hypothetical protein [Acidimicrobiales bacterium]
MSIAEPARHQLHQRLEEILGPDEANTLMSHLPPFTWSDLATKDDLARQTEEIELRLGARIGGLDHKIDAEASTLDHKIDAFGERLDHKIDGVESRLLVELADMRTDFHATMRTNAYLTLGGVSALITMLAAITTLA